MSENTATNTNVKRPSAVVQRAASPQNVRKMRSTVSRHRWREHGLDTSYFRLVNLLCGAGGGWYSPVFVKRPSAYHFIGRAPADSRPTPLKKTNELTRIVDTLPDGAANIFRRHGERKTQMKLTVGLFQKNTDKKNCLPAIRKSPTQLARRHRSCLRKVVNLQHAQHRGPSACQRADCVPRMPLCLWEKLLDHMGDSPNNCPSLVARGWEGRVFAETRSLVSLLRELNGRSTFSLTLRPRTSGMTSFQLRFPFLATSSKTLSRKVFASSFLIAFGIFAENVPLFPGRFKRGLRGKFFLTLRPHTSGKSLYSFAVLFLGRVSRPARNENHFFPGSSLVEPLRKDFLAHARFLGAQRPCACGRSFTGFVSR